MAGALTELDRYDYTYDNVGNRETAEVAGDHTIADSILYGYDGFHRLTSAARRRSSMWAAHQGWWCASEHHPAPAP